MAEFCRQCSMEMFGTDFGDFFDMSTEEDTKEGTFPLVVCEGCGVVQVNHLGECISVDCLKSGHLKEGKRNENLCDHLTN